MAYNEQLANRIRKALQNLPHVVEKQMMGGLTFMVNDKMCVGIIGNQLMCRIDPEQQEMALMKMGCTRMEFTGRPLKGFVLITEEGMKLDTDFDYWIELSLAYNPKAKSSKRKK
jgi:TfoX/Sxy family transcriptional regulator of competence genes